MQWHLSIQSGYGHFALFLLGEHGGEINMEILGIVLIFVHLRLHEGVTKFLRLSNMQKALVKDRSSRFTTIQGGPLPVVSTAITPLIRVM